MKENNLNPPRLDNKDDDKINDTSTDSNNASKDNDKSTASLSDSNDDSKEDEITTDTLTGSKENSIDDYTTSYPDLPKDDITKISSRF